MITRPLRYPHGWPAVPAQEKGVGVALAVDFVKLAPEDEYDSGAMMSTGSDAPDFSVVAAGIVTDGNSATLFR